MGWPRRALLLLLALPSVASAAVIGGVEVPGTPPTSPPGGSAIHRTTSAVFINFDDASQPCAFMYTTALSGAYSALGVTFEGPGGHDGGAVLDQCGNFGVSGHSAPNFLAFNSTALCADGGVPRAPETLHFSPPVTQVSMLVALGYGGGPEPVTLRAYDASNVLVSGQSITPLPAVQLMSVTGPGIAKVVIDGPSVFIIDDLAFDYGVVRTSGSSWGSLKTIYR